MPNTYFRGDQAPQYNGKNNSMKSVTECQFTALSPLRGNSLHLRDPVQVLRFRMLRHPDIDPRRALLFILGTAVSVMSKIPLLECLTRHSYRECLGRLDSSVGHGGAESEETEDEKSAELVLSSDIPRVHNKSLLASFCKSVEHSALDSTDPGNVKENRESSQNTTIEESKTSEELNENDLPSFNVSLLDWINVQDRPNDVESLVRKCFDSMSRLDPKIIQPFLVECRQTIAKLDNQNMKAIKGLEDRLYALDQMIASCSRLVNEQKDLAQPCSLVVAAVNEREAGAQGTNPKRLQKAGPFQLEGLLNRGIPAQDCQGKDNPEKGFLANQKRAENLKDPSVLPDLCLSHANQLMIMLTNHRKLLDIKQKCTTAKQELANNLQVRLKWCCFVMLHADQDGEKLQALFRLVTELLERVKIVEALSTVPQMYCLAVVEVVRRKMFIKHYREWAGALIKDGKHLYEAEKAKRESFGKLFTNFKLIYTNVYINLIKTRKPRRFDSELPDISLTDLQFLQSFCPSEVQPLLSAVEQLFSKPVSCLFRESPCRLDRFCLPAASTGSADCGSPAATVAPPPGATFRRSSPVGAAGRVASMSLGPSRFPQPPLAWSSKPQPLGAMIVRTCQSGRTSPSLSLQGPLCPPVCPPAPLDELSPDSIDAHTFDFETIAHPNLEQALKQGSLDLDSLAESPESDFMSAVNEFVIEENPSSPHIVSDPQSPEMMVESLYSSVINAIDSRRMQDTNICVKEDSLNVRMEKCRVVAQESQFNLRNIKEDLCHFRTFVQKEQCDFSNSLKCTSVEIRNIIQKVKLSLEKTLKDKHQKELQSLKSEYETRIDTLLGDVEENKKKIKKLTGDLIGLEEVLQNKDNEFAMVKNEKEAVVCLQNEKERKLLALEGQMKNQNCEIKELRQSREMVLEDLKKLRIENDEKIHLLRAELQSLEQSHLKELENNLQIRHTQEFEKLIAEHKDCLDKLEKENQQRFEQMQESHAAVVQDKEQQIEELKLKVSDLFDLRCKLEVELALKETETDEMKMLLEESRTQQQEILKSFIDKETENLKKELDNLNHKIQVNNDEYQVGLVELRTLMTIEKDQCISELVDRHEEETNVLKIELNKVTSLHQKAFEVEKSLKEQIIELQSKLEVEANALEKQKEEKLAVSEQKDKFERVIHNLEEEKELLITNQEQERKLLVQRLNIEKEDALRMTLKEFELQRKAVEKELLEKIQLLEMQVNQRPSSNPIKVNGKMEISNGGLLHLSDTEMYSVGPRHRDSGQKTQVPDAPLSPYETWDTGIEALFPCATGTVLHMPGPTTSELEQKKGKAEGPIRLSKNLDTSPSIELSAASSLVIELQEKLEEEKIKFLEQLEEQEKRKNEEMQNFRMSLTAEQQTNFNTVLTREKMKKENIINELSDKLKTITQQQERDKDLIETLSEDRARLLEEKKKLEEDVNKMRSSNFIPSAYLPPSSESCGACAPDLPAETERVASEITDEGRLDSAMETSMMAVHENIHMLSEEKQRIMLLERTLQLKEEENKRLNQRLMSQSMSSVSSRHSEKIAIRDFQVGDLVLIILDERHDNYVLFTVSPTLYFLHSESLAALDLKPGECEKQAKKKVVEKKKETEKGGVGENGRKKGKEDKQAILGLGARDTVMGKASGASRRPWVLGKVMEKEYCQAKKHSLKLLYAFPSSLQYQCNNDKLQESLERRTTASGSCDQLNLRTRQKRLSRTILKHDQEHNSTVTQLSYAPGTACESDYSGQSVGELMAIETLL
ncbi:RB1-inducible coiled-coil protein 1 [Chelonia mydas]|uniref:RB1-inducible coiled-coil protein 1 n=1 Tax=Chelonia mydas TaxID=8469 RepID=M7B8B2_CHEMY|nr:RB1-inducible coiled-coil protein 1 [Chelonia mydas]